MQQSRSVAQERRCCKWYVRGRAARCGRAVATFQEPAAVIAIENGRGIVRLDDSIWTVEGPDLPVGTQVLIVGADGVLLKVKTCV